MCHQVKEQFEKQMFTIQKILICGSMDHGTQIQLKELLDQMKNFEPQFNAGGYFVLDLPVVCTVVSCILTYIIILTQLE